MWRPVLDANDNNATLRKYTWGLDLSRDREGADGIHGAGGIGGLLAAVEVQGTSVTTDDEQYWFFYDANGNVGQILDATNTSSITLCAHYEYDPYGNVIAMADPDGNGYDEVNPFRFSTKWVDTDLAGDGQTGAIGETGLYYYGYRYYSPRLGRWLNRDPIVEKGGMNLYAFVANRPIHVVDPYGLSSADKCSSVEEWHKKCMKLPTKKKRCECHCIYAV